MDYIKLFSGPLSVFDNFFIFKINFVFLIHYLIKVIWYVPQAIN